MTGHSQSSWVNPLVNSNSLQQVWRLRYLTHPQQVKSPQWNRPRMMLFPGRSHRSSESLLPHVSVWLCSPPTLCCTNICSYMGPQPLRILHSITACASSPGKLQSIQYRSSLNIMSIPCHITANRFVEELLNTCCHVQLEDSLLNPYVLQLWRFGLCYLCAFWRKAGSDTADYVHFDVTMGFSMTFFDYPYILVLIFKRYTIFWYPL